MRRRAILAGRAGDRAGADAAHPPRQNRRPPVDAIAERAHRAGIGRRAGPGRVRRAHRPASAPWHFWLVVAMATVYLGWRAVEGVVWLVQWIVGLFG